MIRTLSKKWLAAVSVAGALAAPAAHAGTNVYWSVGINAPIHPAMTVGTVVSNMPAPVYVQPHPVYVQPRPVYVQPRPVVIHPAPGVLPPGWKRHDHDRRWHRRGGDEGRYRPVAYAEPRWRR